MVTPKQKLLASLPICLGELAVRKWCREDVDRRAAWPAYSPPYADFTSSLASSSESQRDTYFDERSRDPSRVTLTIDHHKQLMIGHVCFREIDWQRGMAGNMGFRIHPDCCDKGIGTSVLKAVVIHLARVGILKFRLDVAEMNLRAIRCYEKVGFVKN